MKIFAIHGNGQTKDIFKKFSFNEMEIIELPGHANNSAIENYSLNTYSEYANNFVNEDAIIIGHSLGGHIALEMAQSNQNIKGLILIGAPPINNENLGNVFLPNPTIPVVYEESPSDESLLSFIREGSESRDYDQELLDMFKQQDPKARSGFALSLANGVDDEVEKLKRLQIPYHYFFGAKEKLINIDFNKDILGENMSLINAGHNIMLDNIQGLESKINALINKWNLD